MSNESFDYSQYGMGDFEIPPVPEVPPVYIPEIVIPEIVIPEIVIPPIPPVPKMRRERAPFRAPELPHISRKVWVFLAVGLLGIAGTFGLTKALAARPDAACGYTGRPGFWETVGGQYYNAGELDSFPSSQDGLSHYYGGGEPLNKHTSSGKVFDPNQMWAASWFYPMGTELEVTDTENGRKIHVIVEDRGPDRVQYPNIIIDLTAHAFRTLEPTPGRGEIHVHIEPVCR